ncbi:MAG TPA: hypothetical protein QF695_01010 [Arenicellales bacterium]|jgi:hypothetical protein|nr:hypothetical protein [Gammaproteobacteria bacterium]MDP6026628.1 hypothetical protein [Pseudomonadales bacterium]MDP7450964.1 hypothetical protein [Arenicellales bacterium]MDP7315319.1 hypothetical protein [Pseudomonadales bacterium]MDP7576673.1 hypothetical protein [Pseudomonadales bacterium]|tara:strand:+ start:13381 stop:14454 length:1074 start_codon:yes stop_codon:yes gene_type:complete
MIKFLQFLLLLTALNIQAVADIPRTSSGKPDLSGVYDTGTLTPTERPEWLNNNEYLYPFVARALNWFFSVASEWVIWSDSDPDREAPEAGGEGTNAAGAGRVGGYNVFWVDPGSALGTIKGNVPTSIIYDPPDGRYPPSQPGVSERLGEIYQSFAHDNTGTASWLGHEGPGPFDGPESLAPSERCLISFGATVPTIPSLYNNYKRIIQTDSHFIILHEMVHDARIIRIDSEHLPLTEGQWLGDSVGHWEGDVLVVEAKHFRNISGLPGADENLHVVERFSRQEDGNLYYDFTVTDETVWKAPWSGRYEWQSKPDSNVYEYACHEGNYAMGNILRGARLLEKEWREEQAANTDLTSSE